MSAEVSAGNGEAMSMLLLSSTKPRDGNDAADKVEEPELTPWCSDIPWDICYATSYNYSFLLLFCQASWSQREIQMPHQCPLVESHQAPTPTSKCINLANSGKGNHIMIHQKHTPVPLQSSEIHRQWEEG
jgi:hypothetical protein